VVILHRCINARWFVLGLIFMILRICQCHPYSVHLLLDSYIPLPLRLEIPNNLCISVGHGPSFSQSRPDNSASEYECTLRAECPE
jgi:hypothetical protein